MSSEVEFLRRKTLASEFWVSLENLESKQTDVSGSARFFFGGLLLFLILRYSILLCFFRSKYDWRSLFVLLGWLPGSGKGTEEFGPGAGL